MLLRGREYDPHSALDRQLLAYAFIPVVQHKCVIFVKRSWKFQRGVPDQVLSSPGHYRGTNMGIPVHKDELREVAELSEVMDGDVFDLIDLSVRRECLQLR